MKKKRFIRRQIVLLLGVLLIVLSGVCGNTGATDTEEQYTYFSGILVKVEYGAWAPWGRKAVLVLQPPKAEGETIAIHTGIRTVYDPHRTPKKGDRVNVKCVNSDGLWAAVNVSYID